MFQAGEWQRIHNYRSDEVIWVFGDSRVIPEGFQLIDNNAGIPSDVIDFLMKQYLKDPIASTPTQDVFKYYAIRYIGPT